MLHRMRKVLRDRLLVRDKFFHPARDGFVVMRVDRAVSILSYQEGQEEDGVVGKHHCEYVKGSTGEVERLCRQ